MRFHVLGLGTIGSLLAHHLRRTLPTKHTLSIIHESLSEAIEAQRRGGIRVRQSGITSFSAGFGHQVLRGPARIADKTAEEQELDAETHEIDTLFVTTKACETLLSMRKILHRLAPNPTIVLLQNGLGVYEELVEHLFSNEHTRPHFILASNSHSAFSPQKFEVIHTKFGEIQFGIVRDTFGRDFEATLSDKSIPVSERRLRLADICMPSLDSFDRYQSLRNAVAALLLLSPLETSWVPMDVLNFDLQRKVAVESVLNPLTALMNCKQGQIFTTTASMALMRSMCYEASRVFAADLFVSQYSWAEYRENSQVEKHVELPPFLMADNLMEECIRVDQDQKGNISPMLSDVRSGAQTEIGYLNGYLLNLGRKYGIKMPTHMSVAQLLNMRSAIPLDDDIITKKFNKYRVY